MNNYHPVLISHVENMNQYDVIFLVYPIWHYTLPVSVCAFLDEYDLSGKTMILHFMFILFVQLAD